MTATVDDAIAGADGKPVTRVEMTQARIQLATGRPAVLAFPADLTPLEALGLIGGVLQIAEQLAESRKAASSRIRPASVLPRSLRRG